MSLPERSRLLTQIFTLAFWMCVYPRGCQKSHCPFPVIQLSRRPSPAAHKVQNERNYSENEQKMNQPARYVKNTKAQ